MSWPEIALGDIAELRNGLNYTKDNEGKGLRVINVKDFGDKSFPNYDELGELNPHGILRDEALLKHGDIVFVRSNGNKDLVGRSLFVDNPPLNLSFSAFCIRARLYDSVNPRFYSYFFRTPYFRKRLALLGKGTNISNLNQQVLKMIRVPNPSSAEKSRVVALIRPYDDLIENNRRRIQLMEQAARLLYREWFVRLRFPGHEHVAITDGVPEGWGKKSLTDLADSVSYGLTASSTQEEIGPKFLRITDIVPAILNWEEVPFCEATDKEIKRNRLEIGDVVVARTGATVGYAKLISHLMSKAVYASYLVRFRFRTPTNSLIAGIFMESDSYKEHVKNHAGGAAQPNANAKVLGSAILLIPPQVLQEQFSVSVTPVLNQRDALVRQNTRLAQARDLLLPRLMNGEVAV